MAITFEPAFKSPREINLVEPKVALGAPGGTVGQKLSVQKHAASRACRDA